MKFGNNEMKNVIVYSNLVGLSNSIISQLVEDLKATGNVNELKSGNQSDFSLHRVNLY